MRRTQGFTLIEVLVALVLTGLVISSAVLGLNLILRTRRYAQALTTATCLAETWMTGLTNLEPGEHSGDFEEPGWRWEATFFPIPNTVNLWEVRLQVTGDQPEQSQEFVTLVWLGGNRQGEGSNYNEPAP